MAITADSFFSWQVAAWFAGASVTVAVVWLASRRVPIPWLRVFFRTGIIALCFTPLPHLLMFMEEGAKARTWIITPLWYALFRSIVDGSFFGAAFVLAIWLFVTFFLWVAGMVIYE